MKVGYIRPKCRFLNGIEGKLSISHLDSFPKKIIKTNQKLSLNKILKSGDVLIRLAHEQSKEKRKKHFVTILTTRTILESEEQLKEIFKAPFNSVYVTIIQWKLPCQSSSPTSIADEFMFDDDSLKFISIPTLTFSSPSLDKSHIFSVLRDLILGKIHLKCSRPTLLTIDSQLKKTSIISGDPIHEIDSIFCKYSLSLFSFPLSPSSSFLSTSSKAKDEPIFQKSHSIPPLSTFLTLTPLHLIPATSLPICFLNGPYQLLWTDKE
ncbi:hypothetical protein ADUPG1_008018, partial [Aduncisulcus paluster]